MVARLAAFVIWALVAATAVFWGLRLFASAPAAPSYTVAVGDVAAVRADLSRVLGSAPVATAAAPTTITPEASSRFKLLGIMAPKSQPGASAASAQRGSSGVALIAVDGKLPKAYVVGARVDDDLVLQSVSLRTAAIGPAQGAASIKLELPPPTVAATGTLPAPGAMTNSPAPINQPPVLTPIAPPQPMPARPGVAVQPPAGVAPQFVPQPADGNTPSQVPMVVPPPARDPNAPIK